MQYPRDLHLIGTADAFLRPSALDKLVKCQVWHVMTQGEDDEGGAPAQTGSLVHAAIAAFHQTTDEAKKLQAAIEAIGLNSPKFPLADLNETRLFLTPYLADPRNAKANVIACERPVSLTLDPHPLDPTKQPIIIKGTLDQIRLSPAREYVSDYKSGTPTGWAMIHDYAYQQAAYLLAARDSGYPNVASAEIIRGRGYRTKGVSVQQPDGVYWQMPFTVDQAWGLMSRVQLAIATLRMGYVEYGPGPQCVYCPLGGLDSCQQKAGKKLFGLPMAGTVAGGTPEAAASVAVGGDSMTIEGMSLPEVGKIPSKAIDNQLKAATLKASESIAATLPASVRGMVFPARVGS